MKNIAILNNSDFSSPWKIAYGLHCYLQKKGYHSLLCFGWGKAIDKDGIWNFARPYDRTVHALLARITGLQGFFSFVATNRLIKRLRRENIDTVYLVSTHGYCYNYPMLYEYLGREGIGYVNIMIDEYPYLGKCCFNNGCINYMNGCGNCPQVKEYPTSLIFDTSRYIFNKKKKWYSNLKKSAFVGPQIVIDGAKTSPLLKDKSLHVVDEAIDVSFYAPRNTSALRKELDISKDKFVCVCIAPSNNPRKGVQYYIELAKSLKSNPNYVFVQVGYVEADKSNLPSNYIPIGYVSDQNKLAEYYSLGDLFVFPSLADSMPNACLEAMACGTPLLVFDVSGMSYMIDETVGYLAEVGNVSQMKQIVLAAGKKTEDSIAKVREYAVNRYDNQKYYAKLENIAKSL